MRVLLCVVTLCNMCRLGPLLRCLQLLSDLASPDPAEEGVSSAFCTCLPAFAVPCFSCTLQVIAGYHRCFFQPGNVVCSAVGSTDAREELDNIVASVSEGSVTQRYLARVFTSFNVALMSSVSVGDTVTLGRDVVTPVDHRSLARKLPVSCFSLCPLPTRFDTLYANTVRRKCSQCNTVPDSSALCLCCGAFLCAGDSKCKRDDPGAGPCTLHAKKCGNGIGVFLLVHSSAIVLVRENWACYYPSPYVDHHGEQDCGFRRGLPLSLSPQRYQALTTLWVSHKVSEGAAGVACWNVMFGIHRDVVFHLRAAAWCTSCPEAQFDGPCYSVGVVLVVWW